MKSLIIKISFAFTLLSVALTGCSDPKDKSIFEPLEEKEAIAEAQKDSLFSEIYQDIEKSRDKLDKFSLKEKSKYYKITYSYLLNAMKEMRDLSESDIEKFNKEWELEFEDDERKLDSISHHYNEILTNLPQDVIHIYWSKYILTHDDPPMYDDLSKYMMKDIAPKTLFDYWEGGPDFSGTLKEACIKDLINKNYINRLDYIPIKKFPLIFQFLQSLKSKN